MNLDHLSALAPDLRQLIEARAHPSDRDTLAVTFGSHLPKSVSRLFVLEWARIIDCEGGWELGNEYARTIRSEYGTSVDGIGPEMPPVDATEHDIESNAERIAKWVRMLTERYARRPEQDAQLHALLERIAATYKGALPNVRTVRGKLARMVTASYWRRELRKQIRKAEEIRRRAGFVRRGTGGYVSPEGYARYLQGVRGQRRFLEGHQAVNLATGETLPLDDLWTSSLANPRNRFVAMVRCAQGLKIRASNLGFEAAMVSITTPSRMHAYIASHGQRNPHFDGTTPRQAQRYLSKLWNSAMRAVAHQGIRAKHDYFGFRVVEPHHDGTPHWHVLICAQPEHVGTIVETLRAYAMADSPDEPGAAKHRFNVKTEDPEKGDFVGYMVAYLAKGTDGSKVGTDYETGTDATESAPRAVAWSRIHGIRQFQFFGVGAITPFRELFRLDELPPPLVDLIGPLFDAAQRGDFGAFLTAQASTRASLRVYRPEEQSAAYPGEIMQRLRGVTVSSGEGTVNVITRPDTWTIVRREVPESDSPWTRFNNSAPCMPAEHFESGQARCIGPQMPPNAAEGPRAGDAVKWASRRAAKDAYRECAPPGTATRGKSPNGEHPRHAC